MHKHQQSRPCHYLTLCQVLHTIQLNSDITSEWVYGPQWGQRGADRHGSWTTSRQSTDWGFKSGVTVGEGASLGISLEYQHKGVSSTPHHPPCLGCPQVWAKSTHSPGVKPLSCPRWYCAAEASSVCWMNSDYYFSDSAIISMCLHMQ